MPLRRPRPPARRWRRWAPFAVVALALLAMGELLWRWQTWPVRHLLDIGAGAPL